VPYKQYQAATDALIGICPKDEHEGMMAARLAAAHNAAWQREAFEKSRSTPRCC
jgi:hypothetical protein